MEFVFVVPRRELFPDRYPQGFTPFGEALSAAHFVATLERHGFFVERSRAEDLAPVEADHSLQRRPLGRRGVAPAADDAGR
jgi:hypothetical protein